MVSPEFTVVYIDILGFAALVMSASGGLLDTSYCSNLAHSELQARVHEHKPDELTRTFTLFHRLLELRAADLVQTDLIQYVVFSDSAFVAFRDANTALVFGQEFMRDLIRFRIPARMGIGRGSFNTLRLTTDVSDGFRRHSSQFLGTGVVRAYQAESCGLKGLRIFLDPDLPISDWWKWEVCEIPNVPAGVRVSRELNYVEHFPDFIPRAGIPSTTEAFNALRGEVVSMMETSRSEDRIQRHYKDTLAALTRMQLGLSDPNSPFAEPKQQS